MVVVELDGGLTPLEAIVAAPKVDGVRYFAARWEDALEAYARENGAKWEDWAGDRDTWGRWESGFAQRAVLRG